MVSKHAPRSANPVDVHVGSRVRLRRQVMKMSQERLGDQLGVTSVSYTHLTLPTTPYV